MTRQQLQNWTGYIELPTEHTESEARAIAESLGLTVTQTRIGYKDPNGIKYICTSFGEAFLLKDKRKAVFMKTIPLSSIKEDTDKQLHRKAAWLTALAVAGTIVGATFVIWVIITHKLAVEITLVAVIAGSAYFLVEDVHLSIFNKLKNRKQ
jgi:hypothetical protein